MDTEVKPDGPLAPLFAQVRRDLPWNSDGVAALSSIERHIQDMERLSFDANTLLRVGHGLRPVGSASEIGQEINVGSMGWVDAAVRILRTLAVSYSPPEC